VLARCLIFTPIAASFLGFFWCPQTEKIEDLVQQQFNISYEQLTAEAQESKVQAAPTNSVA